MLSESGQAPTYPSLHRPAHRGPRLPRNGAGPWRRHHDCGWRRRFSAHVATNHARRSVSSNTARPHRSRRVRDQRDRRTHAGTWPTVRASGSACDRAQPAAGLWSRSAPTAGCCRCHTRQAPHTRSDAHPTHLVESIATPWAHLRESSTQRLSDRSTPAARRERAACGSSELATTCV